MDFDDDYVDSLIASSYHAPATYRTASAKGSKAATPGGTGSSKDKARRRKRPPLASLPSNLATRAVTPIHDDKSLNSNSNGEFNIVNTRPLGDSLALLKPFNKVEISLKRTKLNDKAKADPIKESHLVLINGFAEDFRKWCEIRVKYIKQTKNLCKIVSDESNNSSKNVEIYGEFKVHYDSIRPQFLIMLAALRKINCKLVQTFQQTIAELDNSKFNKYDITKHLLRQMELYLYHEVIPSLSWLNRQPFLAWIGIAPTNNPFLLSVTADGSQAENKNDFKTSSTLRSPNELALNDVDHAAAELYNKVLISIYRFNIDADMAAKEHFATGSTSNVDSGNNNRLVGDYKAGEATGNHPFASKEKEQLVDFVQKNLAAGFWWMRWKKSFRISSKITTFRQNKNQQFARRVFNALQTYCWKCVNYRNLQLRKFKNLKNLVFQGWRQYSKWCKKFKKILNRSNRKIKLRYLYVLYDFSQLFHECREFKRKHLLSVKSEVFNNFKKIVLLNKFSLRRRLRANSHLTFKEMFIRKACFFVWFNNAAVLRAYKGLDELVLTSTLGKAFRKLRENAFPTVPFEHKMRILRDAVHKELTKTFLFSKRKFIETAHVTRTLTQLAVKIGREKGLVLMSKMRSKIDEIKQQRADGASLYSTATRPQRKRIVDPHVANDKRRRRIKAALSFSANEGGDE